MKMPGGLGHNGDHTRRRLDALQLQLGHKDVVSLSICHPYVSMNLSPCLLGLV